MRIIHVISLRAIFSRNKLFVTQYTWYSTWNCAVFIHCITIYFRRDVGIRKIPFYDVSHLPKLFFDEMSIRRLSFDEMSCTALGTCKWNFRSWSMVTTISPFRLLWLPREVLLILYSRPGFCETIYVDNFALVSLNRICHFWYPYISLFRSSSSSKWSLAGLFYLNHDLNNCKLFCNHAFRFFIFVLRFIWFLWLLHWFLLIIL